MHKNVHCHGKQNNYCCKSQNRAVQTFLPGKISPSFVWPNTGHTNKLGLFAQCCNWFWIVPEPECRRQSQVGACTRESVASSKAVLSWCQAQLFPGPPLPALPNCTCIFFTSYSNFKFTWTGLLFWEEHYHSGGLALFHSLLDYLKTCQTPARPSQWPCWARSWSCIVQGQCPEYFWQWNAVV